MSIPNKTFQAVRYDDVDYLFNLPEDYRYDEVNERKQNLIHQCAAFNSVKCIKYLIKKSTLILKMSVE